MPWVLNALDSIENQVPYTAVGATSGMSSYKEVPDAAEKMMQFVLEEKTLCGIADYIARVEYTLDPDHEKFLSYIKDKERDMHIFVQKMKDMLKELKARFC